MSNLNGRHVLVLDDELLIGMMVTDSLEEAGCKVIGPAQSVDEAISLIRNSSVDAALLDVKVADRACFPVADALLKQRIPFAFVTGYPESAFLDDYPEVRVISKPFQPMYVVQVVSELIASD